VNVKKSWRFVKKNRELTNNRGGVGKSEYYGKELGKGNAKSRKPRRSGLGNIKEDQGGRKKERKKRSGPLKNQTRRPIPIGHKKKGV